MDAPTAPKPWKAEYAKSSRASCRSCSNLISKDTFRLAKMAPSTQFDGYMAVSTHRSRCWVLSDWCNSVIFVLGSLPYVPDVPAYVVGGIQATILGGIASTPFLGVTKTVPRFGKVEFVIDVKGCVRLLWTREFFFYAQ